ncbi:formin-like protein [Chironomus tepperi]|uniref:formin-like protein n=1 Tax=Chironomus tepperi TaxID=113505 RepID=UPI00391F8A97
MPDKDSLHRSFNQLLGSLDLPNDKIKEMNSYDNHKKWEILCSHCLMKVHQSPSSYLKRLKISPTKETLRGLEVSLRTYSIEWLRDFMNQRNCLDIFVNIINIGNLSSENFQIALQCLRAMLYSTTGFIIVINHPMLLESLVANLDNVSIKNQTLILQLLAFTCKKSPDGWTKILKILKIDDAMRQLMDFLTIKCIDNGRILATLNLIRTILECTTDMNYRIYLQYAFHDIGFDDRIERLMLNESNLILDVIDEITAVKSMIINVNQLIKERDCIKTLNEKLDLKDEKIRNLEMKIGEMEKQLINYKRNQEVEKKDGLKELSDEFKVDKNPDVSSKTEISGMSKAPCAPPPPPTIFSPLLLPIKKKFVTKSKMPTLHWSILRPNRIRGTIFSDIDDDSIRMTINFNHFDDKFRIVDTQQKQQRGMERKFMSNYITLLESNRQRNVSILLRKLNLNADVVVQIINDYNINQLKHENVELLTKLAPKDEEISMYRQYIDEHKDIVQLSDEDKFLLKLSLVERLSVKLNVMEFMGNFNDRVESLVGKICAISSASLSLKSSKKFKGIIEIILTFGNYMNVNKSSGIAYGFHMRGTLEKLNDIRSNDKKQSLLQYIVTDVIAQHFSGLLSINTELLCIKAAARVSMKNVANEITNIQCCWNEMSDECDLSLTKALTTFKESSYGAFNKLINEFEQAQNNYNDCMAYFGECDSTIDSDEFFTIVEKFVAQFTAIVGKVKSS